MNSDDDPAPFLPSPDAAHAAVAAGRRRDPRCRPGGPGRRGRAAADRLVLPGRTRRPARAGRRDRTGVAGRARRRTAAGRAGHRAGRGPDGHRAPAAPGAHAGAAADHPARRGPPGPGLLGGRVLEAGARRAGGLRRGRRGGGLPDGHDDAARPRARLDPGAAVGAAAGHGVGRAPGVRLLAAADRDRSGGAGPALQPVHPVGRGLRPVRAAGRGGGPDLPGGRRGPDDRDQRLRALAGDHRGLSGPARRAHRGSDPVPAAAGAAAQPHPLRHGLVRGGGLQPGGGDAVLPGGRRRTGAARPPGVRGDAHRHRPLLLRGAGAAGAGRGAGRVVVPARRGGSRG